MIRPRLTPLIGLLAAAVAGCAPEPAAENTAARDVQLVEPVAPTEARVSDLEAGRPEPPRPRAAAPATAPVASRPSLTETLFADEPGPVVTTTTAVRTTDLSEAPAPAPVPAEEPVVLVAGPVTPVYEGAAAFPGSQMGGGPTVIIRGGRGGIHDDCDIHRPGSAVNRLVPLPRGISLRGPASVSRQR